MMTEAERVRTRFTLWHLGIFFILWVGFSGLTFLAVKSTQQHWDRVFPTTACAILGPMTGAISRNLQSCCLEFSLSLLLPCSAGLLVGFGCQFIPGRHVAVFLLRLLMWTLGWLVWFGGGIVSFAHALS